jgi:thymidylate kinase
MLVTPEGFSENVNLVGLTGAHGTGKTTLVNEFVGAVSLGQVALPEGLEIRLVPEQATTIRLQLGDPDLFTKHNSYQLQRDIMLAYIFAPAQVLSLVYRQRKTERVVVLTDRTVVDPISYAKLAFSDEWRERRRLGTVETFAPDMARLYRGVAILPTGAIPLVSGDGLRSEDPQFQAEADAQLRQDYQALGIPLYELTADAAMDARIADLASFIGDCLLTKGPAYPLNNAIAPAPLL